MQNYSDSLNLFFGFDNFPKELEICFANKSELILRSGWTEDNHIIPFLTISHCKKKKCKSKMEAAAFINKL